VTRGRWIVVVAAAALLYAAAADARLGYDTAYQLVWGRELLDGRLPQYEVRLAPTPHPLQVLVAAPLSLLGQAADEAMRALSLLSLALLAAGVWRIGERLFTAPVGALAAAVVITRPHLIELAYLGDADVPAAALAAWAAVVALGDAPGPRTRDATTDQQAAPRAHDALPRAHDAPPPAHDALRRAHDAPPRAHDVAATSGVATRRELLALGLLALAGLLRPEAWLLSAAYFAWVARARPPRALVPLAALAAAGPLLWALSDVAVTGDLLWSLHHTRTGTELLDRPTGAAEAVEQLPRHLNFLLGTPALVVGLFGFAAGLIAARQRMWGLVAVLVLLGGGFLVLALAGLSLQPRYLTGLAAAIAVCAGIGGLGWPVLGRRWRAACVAALVLLAAGLPFDVAEYADVRGRVVDDGRQLEELARGDARAAIRGCGPVAVPTIRPIPYLALWTGAEPDEFAEAGAAPAGGTLVTPTETSESWAGGGGEGQPPRVVTPPPPGYAEVAANEGWRVYATC
jgi:hypothetical protein